MYLFGTTLLVLGIATALLACISYVLVIRGNRAALSYARAGIYGMFGSIAGVCALLIIAFATRRFDIEYVYNYSSSDLDAFFTVAAIWAGQPGSFAIWIFWSAIVAVLLVGRSRHFEPYVLSIISVFIAALMFFTLILNPFTPIFETTPGGQQVVQVPPDGAGLNPLLHNFWMIIHPPILFWGWALAIVPFAFAVAGLLRRDYDTWVTRALPWTLASWIFMGLALLLGGYWAYETLGWGGYWGWDPVENSSLVPWLLLTALLHGMLVQRSHGSLRRTNIVLALFTFATVFYSTFLTRSGVLEDFSVHTFVSEGIYGWMLAFMTLLAVGSLTALVLRWRDIPVRSLSDKFFSRDNFFVLAMLTLGIIAGVVLIGTSMPLISAIPGVGPWLQGVLGAVFELDDGTQFGGQPLTDGRFNVATSFYTTTTPPLGIVAVVLLIIAPLLGWRDTNMRALLRAMRWPGAAAVLAGCAAVVIGVRDALPLAYVVLSVFALGVNLLMLIRTMRGGWLRVGGYLAHIGVAIMMIGFVGSSVYATPDVRLTFESGDTVTFQDYAFTFNEWQVTEDGGGVLDLTVNRGEQEFSARPELYFDRRMGSTMQNPHIQSFIWHDLYITPVEHRSEKDPTRPVMSPGNVAEMGPYEIVFEDFEMDMMAMQTGEDADVGARLLVTYEGEETMIVPSIRRVTNAETGERTLEPSATPLPGGDEIQLVAVVPDQSMIMLQAAGDNVDNLPVQPAQAQIAVSTKPAVLLVWVGLIVGVLGGLLAFVRRYLEGRARLSGQRVRLPKLPGLPGKKPGWRGGSAAR